MPLVMHSHGPPIAPALAEKCWTRYQEALVHLSSDATHVVATTSHHYVHKETAWPVPEAVQEVVAAVRG